MNFGGILKLPNNNPFETVHMKFCKELLVVQKQTTKTGVLQELDQLPLSVHEKKHAIKNWVRLTNDKQCNTLVSASLEHAANNNLMWPKRMEGTLAKIGLLNTFISKDSRAHIQAFQRMSDIFYQDSFSEIKKKTSKLRTYSTIKTQTGFENYLCQIQNIQDRVSLTKFRLSNHRLMIETGRHQRIDKDQRFCPFCPTKIEDEAHFLLECKVFSTLRVELFNKALNEEGNFMQLENSEKFVTLLSNPAVMRHTANHISKTFHIREYLLRNHKNPI